MKSYMFKIICIFLIIQFFINPLALANQNSFNSLSFEDYIELSKDRNYKNKIVEKILNTPTVDNSISNPIENNFKKHSIIGKYIRVAQWDIDFNLSPDNIESAFLNPQKLINLSKQAHETNDRYSMIDPKEKRRPTVVKMSSFDEIRALILDESKALNKSDVIVINNIDIGMPNTGYVNNPKQLAHKLGYNYVFVPEFIEVDPATMGLEKYEWSEAAALKDYGNTKEYIVDKNKYKGIIGTAILSKYPLKNIRVLPLENVYDWYEDEKNSSGVIENHFRVFKKKIFKETVVRHIRIGRRVAILADIKLPKQICTIAALQIEGRSRANERAKQMKDFLNKIKEINNPIIVAGNLNTSSANNKPRSAKSLISDTFTDGDSFIQAAGTVASLAGAPFLVIGFGLKLALSSFDVSRKSSDPTVISIPYFSPNREKKMINAIKRFRFEDGYAFDFRGNKNTSYNDSRKLLSSSNQRALKGFVATYKTKRNVGAYSNYKLSWILSKAYNEKPNKTKHTTEKMAPHFGRTLFHLNFEYKYPIAKQAPIIADFPLDDYTEEKL